MLVLSRRPGEAVVIEYEEKKIRVFVLERKKEPERALMLGFEAPPEFKIRRAGMPVVSQHVPDPPEGSN